MSPHPSLQVLAAALLLLFSAVVVAQQSPPKPNLLVILTDQQRFDAIRRVQEELNYPVASRIRTPNIDRLSYEGAYFRNAYTHCAVCGPARTSFFTGHTIENTGVRTNRMTYEDKMNLPGNDAADKIPAIRTYDEILVEDHDFVAEYYGKWHTPESKGFCYSNDVRVGGSSKVRKRWMWSVMHHLELTANPVPPNQNTKLWCVPPMLSFSRQAWFGKYENDNVTKHYAVGMTEHYWDWLTKEGYPSVNPRDGEQTNVFSQRPYVPDTLDSRYGLPPDTTTIAGQPDCHGKNSLPEGLSITAQQGSETLEALERLNSSGKPFSLHLSFHSPHAPMIATPGYHSMYDPSDMHVPASISDDMTNSAYRAANNRLSLDEFGYSNPSKVQRWIATYYGLITEIDEWIGKILDKLDELGIADDTLLVFSSDHGEMLGSHGMREKNIFLEESARVPLILRFPGRIRPGTVVDSPVSHLDLYSTLLDYLGITGNYKSDGNSLRRHIEGTDDDNDFVVTAWNFTDSFTGNRPPNTPHFMIRKGMWKLMMAGGESFSTLDMLYNLKVDPAEMNNLVGKNGATADDETIGKAEHLKAMLVKYLEETEHPAVEEVKGRKKWRSLGLWVGDTVINFRNRVPSTEYLYIGAGSSEDIEVESVMIGGNLADHFSLDWDPLDNVIPAKAHSVIAITYMGQSPGSSDSGAGSATVVIRHDGGEEKEVTLVPPTGSFEQSLKCVAVKLLPRQKLRRGKTLCLGDRQFGLSSIGELSYWIGGVKVWTAGFLNGEKLILQRGGVLFVKDSSGIKLWNSNRVPEPEKRMNRKRESVLEIDGDGPRLVAPDGDITWVYDCQAFGCGV